MATFDLGRVTPIYKGDYSASASYELNDVVLYNGNLYWHVQSTPTVGILPTDTTVWKLAFADEGVRAEIRGYADNAQNSADSALASKSAAAQSASQASASESHAALSAQTAQTAETGATASAQTASTKASEATASAQSAASSAQTATDKATLASQKAAAASESASLATAKANAAATSETNATTAAQTATTKASEAAASATSAHGYNDSAQQSAVNAQTSATNAAASEAAAKRYAEDSAAYLGAYPTDTAEGEIASFSDGADDIPLKSLVVDIEPVQDLHGYDSPWPAGGWKNLIPYPYTDGNSKTINGVTFTVDEYGVITANGTATANAEFVLINTVNNINLPSGSYMLSGLPSSAGSSSFVFNTYAGHSISTDLWDVRTPGRQLIASDSISKMYISVRIVSGYTANNLVIKPQFESGTIATAYAPYSNICPISGWTGCEVTRTGVNIWNEEWEIGNWSIETGEKGALIDRIRCKNYIPVLPGKSYYFKFPDSLKGRILCYDKSQNYLGQIVNNDEKSAGVYTTPENCCYVTFNMRADYGTTYNNDISINYPSSDHDYHPYVGYTSPISWESEAGTVYGGTLDVTNGVLTVTKGFIQSYNGEALPSTWISDMDVYAQGATPTTGAEVCYDLATPITYQLTPTEVRSLFGVNSIFADTGDTTVEYRADTSAYIAKKIAEAISALS